jgi:parallel beta helix pectate lyase-like protein
MIKLIRTINVVSIAIMSLYAVNTFAAYEEFHCTATGRGNKSGSSLSNAMGITELRNSANWSATDETVGKVDPGDTVLLYDDDGVFGSMIIIRQSGTASQYIRIQAASGENPVIKTTESGVYAVSKSYLRFSGITIKECKYSGMDFDECSDITVSGVTIEKNGTSGIIMTAHDIVSRNNKIDNCIIKNNPYPSGQPYGGVNLRWGNNNGYFDDFRVLYSVFDGNGEGIRAYAPNHTVRSTHLLIKGNILKNSLCGGAGIQDWDDRNGEVRIYQNQFYDNKGANGGLWMFRVSGVVAEYNKVTNNTSTTIDGRGIYITGAEDVWIRYNYIKGHRSVTSYPSWSAGITCNSENAYVYGNVIVDNYVGIIVSHRPMDGEVVDDVFLYNNTLVDNNYGISLQDYIDSSEVKIKNNIIKSCSSYGIYDVDNTLDPTLDYNCYYDNGQDLYQVSGMGANSFNSDPDLNSFYELNSSSPCIDANADEDIVNRTLLPGTVWPNSVSVGNQNDYGNSFEIGAYVHDN